MAILLQWFDGLVVWWFGGLVVWWFGGLMVEVGPFRYFIYTSK
ncbi:MULTISPECIES: hypothetical protein [Aerococcus]|nr:hypothetical protein [Aerococcus viridans]MEC1386039.1 hypothetical protein [Aerococcus viridans]